MLLLHWWCLSLYTFTVISNLQRHFTTFYSNQKGIINLLIERVVKISQLCFQQQNNIRIYIHNNNNKSHAMLDDNDIKDHWNYIDITSRDLLRDLWTTMKKSKNIKMIYDRVTMNKNTWLTSIKRRKNADL